MGLSGAGGREIGPVRASNPLGAGGPLVRHREDASEVAYRGSRAEQLTRQVTRICYSAQPFTDPEHHSQYTESGSGSGVIYKAPAGGNHVKLITLAFLRPSVKKTLDPRMNKLDSAMVPRQHTCIAA